MCRIPLIAFSITPPSSRDTSRWPTGAVPAPSIRQTLLHQNGTDRVVLVHLNVTCYPHRGEAVTFCTSLGLQRRLRVHATRPSKQASDHLNLAKPGLSARQKPDNFFSCSKPDLSMLVAYTRYRSTGARQGSCDPTINNKKVEPSKKGSLNKGQQAIWLSRSEKQLEQHARHDT